MQFYYEIKTTSAFVFFLQNVNYRILYFFAESAMSAVEPRTVFCASTEEDYLEVHSPTDSSEDSVEVKISPICLKNKRKCAEPRKVQDTFTGPLKKRVCLKVKSEAESQHFRPWSETKKIEPKPPAMFYPPPVADQPVALIKKREIPENGVDLSKVKVETVEASCSSKSEPLRVPIHPHLNNMSTVEAERLILNSAEAFPKLQQTRTTTTTSKTTESSYTASSRKEQRNYKNMTRERRIEANARERTRVHTISAAFDTLRRSIPSYSHNQKLSKLSVLRIACSYIMTLSSMVGDDSGDMPPTSECVEIVSRTIQREGKLRKKKDESD